MADSLLSLTRCRKNDERRADMNGKMDKSTALIRRCTAKQTRRLGLHKHVQTRLAKTIVNKRPQKVSASSLLTSDSRPVSRHLPHRFRQAMLTTIRPKVDTLLGRLAGNWNFLGYFSAQHHRLSI